MNLEAALKKRINEFRELCLKEGEITGHLPADYPLQPREPIPQVRRRITRSNGNIPNEFQRSLSSGSSSSVMPPPRPPPTLDALRSSRPIHTNFALPNGLTHLQQQHPSRPTSTNSSSSNSTSSSNKHIISSNGRNLNPVDILHVPTTNAYRIHTSSSDVQLNLYSNREGSHLNNNNNNNIGHYVSSGQQTEHTAAIMLQRRQKQLQQQRQQHQQQMLTKNNYDQLFTLPNHFKKPSSQPVCNPNFDSESLGHMRAGSTASGSSTVSAYAAIPSGEHNLRIENLPMNNLHGRSCSEDVTNIQARALTGRQMVQNGSNIDVHLSNTGHLENLPAQEQKLPVRPPRGVQSNNLMSDTTKTHHLAEKQASLESNINGLTTNGGRVSEKQQQRPLKMSAENLNDLENISNGVRNIQPYYEETKPFQMSDFYKYSSKHRQKMQSAEDSTKIFDNITLENNKPKTTRQLQAEIATMKNPLKFAACDDQINLSRKLIEKSDQKLMKATAKAIASNPRLAERLNGVASSVVPNGNRY